MHYTHVDYDDIIDDRGEFIDPDLEDAYRRYNAGTGWSGTPPDGLREWWYQSRSWDRKAWEFHP